LLQRINEWWTGVFYGNVPEIDRCGHGFVHHRNEMEADDWGNSHLDRASLFQFCQWVSAAAPWLLLLCNSTACTAAAAAAHRVLHSSSSSFCVTSHSAKQMRRST
jgi:hypothetical protein